jgi:hypothetical protein
VTSWVLQRLGASAHQDSRRRAAQPSAQEVLMKPLRGSGRGRQQLRFCKNCFSWSALSSVIPEITLVMPVTGNMGRSAQPFHTHSTVGRRQIRRKFSRAVESPRRMIQTQVRNNHFVPCFGLSCSHLKISNMIAVSICSVGMTLPSDSSLFGGIMRQRGDGSPSAALPMTFSVTWDRRYSLRNAAFRGLTIYWQSRGR